MATALPVIDPAAFLPVPQAIEPLDYESLFQAWLTKFKELFADYGNVGVLETDPGVIIAQAMSYMRLLDRARINEAYEALRLALATGANLDGLAADRGVVRQVYVAATATTPSVVEDDESLRLRSWLRMQTWGSGTPLGVEYHARTLGLQNLADVRVIDYPGEGRMKAVLLPIAGLGSDATTALLSTVGAGLMTRRRRPGAVWIDTVLAGVDTIDYTGTIGVRRGASPATVVASAVNGLTAYMATRRRVGAIVPIDAILASQRGGSNVIWVHPTSPSADVVEAEDRAAQVGTVTITPQVVDD